MNKHKFIVGAGLIASIALAATAAIASAQTATSAVGLNLPAQKMVVQIGPAGNVTLRGTVGAVSSGVLTIKSWGGDWTVDVGASAKIMPASAGNDLTQFKAGDFVSVNGEVSQSAAWTVDATLVRDRTLGAAVTREEKRNVQQAREAMNANRPRNYIGTASGVNGSSFTLTLKNGTADAVNVAANAEVVNRLWATLPIASIQTGDNIHVWGVNASGTIAARIVRDLSVPVSATSTAR